MNDDSLHILRYGSLRLQITRNVVLAEHGNERCQKSRLTMRYNFNVARGVGGRKGKMFVNEREESKKSGLNIFTIFAVKVSYVECTCCDYIAVGYQNATALVLREQSKPG